MQRIMRDTFNFIFNPNALLDAAIEEESIEKIEKAISAGADVNNTEVNGGINGRTPLANAIAHQNSDIVAVLLQCGADPNKCRDLAFENIALPSLPPLNAAAHNITIFKQLIDAGADIHNNKTLIFTAMSYPDVLAYLLQKGINVNQINGRCTPLTVAVSINLERVRVLVDAGADVNLAATNGMTPLIKAAEIADIETARYLLEHGANINQATDEGTPLIRAIKMLPYHSSRDARSEMLCFLLAKGANVNVVDKKHQHTPLMIATKIGDLGTVKLLLSQGAEINEMDVYHNTALHYAAMHHHYEITTELARAGAEGNIKNNDGHTLLKWMKDYNQIKGFFAIENTRNNTLKPNADACLEINIRKQHSL